MGKQEILNDCSQGSGCGHDKRQVWVSDLANTNAPTISPTISSAPSTVDGDAVIVCGAKSGYDKCPERVDIVGKSEEYAVRCCSDSLISGWRKTPQCNVWAGSELPACYNAKTFSEAGGICSNLNTRLCTKQEILNDCSQGSGCGHDKRQVWVSDLANTNAPTISPTVSSAPSTVDGDAVIVCGAKSSYDKCPEKVDIVG